MSMTSTTSRPLPRPLHLVSNSTGSSVSTSGLPTPLSAGRGPLSAPLNVGRNGINEFDVALAQSRPHPRRQSSISYNTGSKSRSSGLGRSNSVGSAAKDVERGDENRSPRTPTLPGVRETEPVTLAEKHADLLRFIAQKESKCLELRTQLAQHEADLLLLKRKWERIVSKGSPSTAKPEGDMLDGIREGMQSGLGKVLAALEPAPAAAARYQDVSSKRASTSTVSSSSTRARSSLSASGSSASSMFDDLAGMSSASSVADDSTTCASPDTKEKASAVSPRPFKAFKRNSSSFTQPPECELLVEAAASHADDDPSGKKRRSRPTSMNLSTQPQLSSPLSATSLSPALGKQVSNWVPGLNKRWEELKGNETISKQSKRASVLLSDVLAALSQPTTPSQSTLAPVPGTHVAPSRTTLDLDSAFFDPMIGSKSPSPSLLDDEDDCAPGLGGGMGDVLMPEVKSPAVVPRPRDESKSKEEAEEEWNW